MYKKCDRLDGENLEWVRASASLPLVSEVVKIDGMKLQDGGISDLIPLKYFESIGYDRNLVVLTRPRGYRKSPNRAMAWVRMKYKKSPQFVRAMERRHEMYNETLSYIEQEEAAGRLLVIAPEEELPVRRVEKDPEKLREAYELGRKATLARMEEILRFLFLEEK